LKDYNLFNSIYIFGNTSAIERKTKTLQHYKVIKTKVKVE